MNQDEKRALETELIIRGLDGLDDPELLPMFGRAMRDHSWLQGALEECDDDKRRDMYYALKPHLPFKPWEFDAYMNRIIEKASAAATWNEPVQVGEEKYRRVAESSLASGAIATLLCYKCTAEESFLGDTPVDAIIKARKAGWYRDLIRHKEVCPKCQGIDLSTRLRSRPN